MDEARATQLDSGPIIALRGDSWCCLLCKRQFKSEDQLSKHILKSSLHRDNLGVAMRSNRILGPKRPFQGNEADGNPTKKTAVIQQHAPTTFAGIGNVAASAEAPAIAGNESTVAMSALERMELFEKQLKMQAKQKPDKEIVPDDEVKVDSNKARTINNQMDWECSGCQQVTPPLSSLQYLGTVSA